MIRPPHSELALKGVVHFTNTCTHSYSLYDVIIKIEWIRVIVMVTVTFCSYRVKHKIYSRHQPTQEPMFSHKTLSKPDQEFLSNFQHGFSLFISISTPRSLSIRFHQTQHSSRLSCMYIYYKDGILVVPTIKHI